MKLSMKLSVCFIAISFSSIVCQNNLLPILSGTGKWSNSEEKCRFADKGHTCNDDHDDEQLVFYQYANTNFTDFILILKKNDANETSNFVNDDDNCKISCWQNTECVAFRTYTIKTTPNDDEKMVCEIGIDYDYTGLTYLNKTNDKLIVIACCNKELKTSREETMKESKTNQIKPRKQEETVSMAEKNQKTLYVIIAFGFFIFTIALTANVVMFNILRK